MHVTFPKILTRSTGVKLINFGWRTYELVAGLDGYGTQVRAL